MSPHRAFPRTVALALVGAALTAACALPDLDEERALAETLPQTSFIYASDGTLITTLHAEQDRILIPPGRIPQALKDAVVAIEDQRFWSHRGVDLKALLRAARANAEAGEIVQGGSTITQQYVKNTITGAERTVDRKLKEAVLAFQLEREMSKEEILGSYLNTVYFGRGAYGIRAAGKAFFRKRVADLSLGESALLAGLIASPAGFDPVEKPDDALARRNLVLDQMLALGTIDAASHADARSSPLGLRLAPDRDRYAAPYFVEHVKRAILRDERFGQTSTQRYNFLFAGGLRIHTTIDLELQQQAEAAIDGILSQPDDPYGAMTVIDPSTGHIKAMVGGRDFFATPKQDRFAKVNLATGGSTGRQAGSAFKPFALVAALENGISPEQRYVGGRSIALDDPVCRNGPGAPWLVENYEGTAVGEISLEEATVRSTNVVYAQVIRDVGPQTVVDAANRMGIESRLRPLCSAVLGANEVNPLEMASAYGTLATMGTHIEPIAIERIEDASGQVVFEAAPPEEQIVAPGVAWTATQILADVVDRGTGVAADIGRPAAGKTGTAQLWRDAWFVGFIPQLVASVWVGFPEGQIPMVPPRTRIRVTGGSFPAQIWRAFMLSATERIPVEPFVQPAADFVQVAIDVTQGCVANEFTPKSNVRVLDFVAGTEPRVECPQTAAPEPSAVPSVVGMDIAAAVRLLEDSGFVVTQTSEYDPGAISGTVVRQEPPAGTEATTGTEVALVVATDSPPLEEVPDVVGLARSQAEATLEGAGFTTQVLFAPSSDTGRAPGVVLGQTPSGGEVRPIGSTVTITVEPGASPSPSPTAASETRSAFPHRRSATASRSQR